MTDVNEPPVITSGASAISFSEGSTDTVGTYRAADPEGASITWRKGGPDADKFTFSGDTLKFAQAPDYEAPSDANTDRVYSLEVEAYDGVLSSPARTVEVTVTDVNEPPVITSGATAVTFSEGSTDTVGTYRATDPEGASITWQKGGPDAGKFTFSGDTLRFAQAPDYEAPSDANTDRVYSLEEVWAYDGVLSSDDTLTVDVTVRNVDEAGTVTLSPSQPRAGAWVTATLREPDKGVKVQGWKWQRRASETDQWGNIAFSGAQPAGEFFQGPSYRPVAGDVGQMLRATVSYTDGESADATDFKSAQSPPTAAVQPGTPGKPGNLNATEGDRQVELTWTPAPDNGSQLTGYQYRKSAKSGSISSQSWTEITGSTAATTSYTVTIDLVNGQEYTFQVRAKNEEGDGLGSSTVDATPSNREPVITSGPGDTTFAENGTGVVATYTATDADDNSITWSLEGTDNTDFQISGSGGLRFSPAPDYENPDDSGSNNVYNVTVKATDNGSPSKSSSRAVTVTVTDVNEPPLTPSAPSVSAASSNGHERLSVSWTAPGTSGRPGISDYDVQYRRTGTTGWSAHSFTGTGTSTTISGLATDTEYKVQVLAKNAEGSSSWSSSGSGRTRPNTAPSFTSGPTSKSVAENNRSVGSYSATDAEGHSISWSLEGTDAGDFSKTVYYGVLSLSFASAPDYESPDDSGGNNVYNVTVKATDNGSPSKSSTRAVTVTVTDVNEPPPPPSAPSVSAASSNGHERLSVSWTAPGTSGRPGISDYDVQYRRTGTTGWSAHSFTGTGTSTTISGLATDTEYKVQVLAKNAEGSSSWSSSGSGRTRPNTAPSFTSGPTSKSVAENNRSVGSYSATDAEGHSISWSLEGTDAGDFSKTVYYGVLSLSFASAPDYESPDDSGGNNVYNVTVKATDNGSPSKSSTRAVTVTVTDVNEPPPPPSAPSVSAASSNGHERLSVSWTAPGTSGRPGISDYDVQYRRTGTTGWSAHSFTGTGTSTTISGLATDTEYKVQVLAKNAEGSSSWSSSGSGRTRPNTAPSFTSGPTSKSVAENNRSVGSYSATDAEGHSISWSLEGTDAGDFSKTVYYGVLSLSFASAPDYESPDDSGGNNVYNVTVKATDNGSPKKSSTRAVTVTVTDVNEPPDAPTGVSVSAPSSQGHQRLSVSWSAPSNSGPALSGYDVQYCKTNEVPFCDSYSIWSSRSAAGSATSKLLTGLSSSTGYTVQVRAKNPEGTSGWSSRATGSTAAEAAKALSEQLAETGDGLAALAAPNPFNSGTTLYFQMTESEEVSLVIYTLAGQVVKTLIAGRPLTSGIHEEHWEGRDEQGRPVGAGVYLYRLTAGKRAIVRKMTLLR